MVFKRLSVPMCLWMGLLLTLSGCTQSTPKCTPESCGGCCTADGVCQSGDSNTACGVGANVCQACSGTNVCRQNACQPPLSGTGGGAPGTGGGTAMPGTPEMQLQAVRAAADGVVSPALSLDNVTVTGLKPQIAEALLADGGSGDLPGFFVQGSKMGPAVFVRAKLPTTPEVMPGMTVSLRVNEVGTQTKLRVVTQFDMLTVVGTAPLSGLVQEASQVNFDLEATTAEYESELVSVAGTVAGAGFANAGLGYRSAPFVTTANPQRPDGGFGPLRLRLPEKIVDAEGLGAGCTVSVDSRPLWRFNAQPQVSAFAAGQLTQVTCPAPRLLSAATSDATTVRLAFDRNIDPNSANVSAFIINGVTVTAVTVNGKTVELKTSMLTPDTDYTVMVSVDVKDTRQTGVSAAANTASLRLAVVGPGPAVVLSQIYGGGGNSNAVLKSDFVELHNRSNMPVSLEGWSLHYASAASMSAKASGKTTFAPGTSIPAGGYFLVEGASGGDAGMPAPAADSLFGEPDAGLVNLSGTNGKVFLSARADDVLLGADGCPVADSGVVGTFAYGNGNCKIDGVSSALSSTTAASRKENGCTLTGPAAADFEVKAPAPRNSASPAVICP